METQNENKARILYYALLDSWNNNSANDFAGLFTKNGNVIGFDGSQMNGPNQIKEELGNIFENHKVAYYVGIIREIRQLSQDVYVLRAVAGMVPPGKSEIKPEVNTIQTLIIQKENEKFKIALYQNTPAAFHGRPELSTQLTAELQQLFDNYKVDQLLE